MSLNFIFLIILLLIQIPNIFAYDDFYEINECSPDTCPYPSICISSTICKCKKGFYNTNIELNDYKNKCSYEMKSSYSPFWVEIITNLGIGHILI